MRSKGLEDRSVDVLRALDKLPKIGADAVASELETAGIEEVGTRGAILLFAESCGGVDDTLTRASELVGEDEQGVAAISRLRSTCEAAIAAGVPAERLQVDLSIARGLDYYTGIIYETFLDALPGIGSVCSGGRYDNLADLFSSQPLPGVGASLGLDRLLAALEELGKLSDLPSTPARVLVAVLDAGHEAAALRVAANLRAAGLPTEVYPAVRNPKHAFKYADRKGFEAVVLAGSQEFEAGCWQIKTLADGQQSQTPDGEVALEVSRRLEPAPLVAS